jgi:hypothetical protein
MLLEYLVRTFFTKSAQKLESLVAAVPPNNPESEISFKIFSLALAV